MKTGIRTYYKAFFLLLLFSSNTVISFACSYSSLFHSAHHHKAPRQSTHDHGDQQHQHDHAANHHQAASKKEGATEKCCSTAVLKLQKVDKEISRIIDAPTSTPAFTFLSIALFQQADLLPAALTQYYSPHAIRWRFPTTIQDLRIVIQSFQI